IDLPHVDGSRYYDVWHGVELSPRVRDGKAVIELPMEARGFGAVLSVQPGVTVDGLEAFLQAAAKRAAQPLNSYSAAWTALPQQLREIPATAVQPTAPEGMVSIPAGEFVFNV